MKIFLIIILAALLLVPAGCSDTPVEYEYIYPAEAYQDSDAQDSDAQDSVIILSGPLFSAQVQDIQMHREYYLGRTIRYEGLFLSSYWDDEEFYFVARLEGGCCGIYGFEVYLNDFPPPVDETWVEVTGILEEFYVEGFGSYLLRLNVTSLIIIEME